MWNSNLLAAIRASWTGSSKAKSSHFYHIKSGTIAEARENVKRVHDQVARFERSCARRELDETHPTKRIVNGFFAAVRAKALANGAALAGLEQFLDAFHSSFKDGVVSEEEVDLGKLVWAEDFNAVLHQRGLDRAARAAEAAAADADGGGSGDGALEGMLRAGLAGESA